jgi:hypothetical protein
VASRARNDQTAINPASDGPKGHKLTVLGEPPIRTDGKASLIPTRVEFNGKLLLEMNLQDGTWEYLAEPGRALLYLDTGDIALKLPERPCLIRWHAATDVIEMKPLDNTLTIPAGIRYTEIVWEKPVATAP